ncbi:hypothetical protein SODALDRAFT_48042 [Sodiomyces alkalinus F11]|uniref:Uncharacterized protein n=1 Tax=Sodiomyces alkalinus (strain CBS 110278 / VKM F-3762 / F11) TaxID=1314773 RepID=A0A3N2QAN2_SODAK|nr:hypothetical protein SODALDRAFT_48042 [Sodiomyces alkalinus F11]ROT43809.1 hypothetical protein SODALDRAFT_48042 [Sodiomyces alkalinus F11]
MEDYESSCYGMAFVRVLVFVADSCRECGSLEGTCIAIPYLVSIQLQLQGVRDLLLSTATPWAPLNPDPSSSDPSSSSSLRLRSGFITPIHLDGACVPKMPCMLDSSDAVEYQMEYSSGYAKISVHKKPSSSITLIKTASPPFSSFFLLFSSPFPFQSFKDRTVPRQQYLCRDAITLRVPYQQSRQLS